MGAGFPCHRRSGRTLCAPGILFFLFFMLRRLPFDTDCRVCAPNLTRTGIRTRGLVGGACEPCGDFICGAGQWYDYPRGCIPPASESVWWDFTISSAAWGDQVAEVEWTRRAESLTRCRPCAVAPAKAVWTDPRGGCEYECSNSASIFALDPINMVFDKTTCTWYFLFSPIS